MRELFTAAQLSNPPHPDPLSPRRGKYFMIFMVSLCPCGKIRTPYITIQNKYVTVIEEEET
jgi:hypothetical protein